MNNKPEVQITPAGESTYVGRVITVNRKFRPAYSYDYTNSYSGETSRIDVDAWEVWSAAVDGKGFQGLISVKSAQDATNRAKRTIDRINADEAIYASLQSYVGRVDVALGAAERGPDGKLCKPVIATNVAPAGAVKVGDRVVAYSRGSWRRALIAKVGRKNVEIAYVARVGGPLTRKSIASTDVYVEVQS